MYNNELTGVEKQLADFMNEISEDAYSASWESNLEYILWDAVINGERQYARHFISKEDIDYLTKLSTDCNCWIYFDDDTERTAIPLDEWRMKFNQDRSIWLQESKRNGNRHITIVNRREPFKTRRPRVAFFLRRILRMHLPFISTIIRNMLNSR
jgi:hypothetical protein